MAAKIRIHELAKELGMTNKETLDLSLNLGIGVKTHSSGIEEAQADRVRRRAERDGLTRSEQPEEPKPVKATKASKAKSSKKAAPAAPAPESPAGEKPAAEKPAAEAPESVAAEAEAPAPAPA
ncbi:MAG TPA: translation initiation factor IF-2 N-terminal domain-containing protein, partial [Acidimicrobiales bacterium]|nr:translation initiation factor IF-2 N-terminal domain-containing protein [Acidimicrobiales bacterium]